MSINLFKVKPGEIIFDLLFFLLAAQLIRIDIFFSLYEGGLLSRGITIFLTVAIVAGCAFLLYIQFLLLSFKNRILLFFLLAFMITISIYNFVYVFTTFNTLEFGISKEDLFASTIESSLVFLSISVGLVIFSMSIALLVSLFVDTVDDSLMHSVFESMIKNDKWLLKGENLLFLSLFILTPLVLSLLVLIFDLFVLVFPMMCVQFIFKLTNNETIASGGWILYFAIIFLLIIIYRYLKLKLNNFRLFSFKKEKKVFSFKKERKILLFKKLFSGIKQNKEVSAKFLNEFFNIALIGFINFYLEFLLNRVNELNWEILLISGVIPARLYLFLTPPIRLSGVISALAFILALILFLN